MLVDSTCDAVPVTCSSVSSSDSAEIGRRFESITTFLSTPGRMLVVPLKKGTSASDTTFPVMSISPETPDRTALFTRFGTDVSVTNDASDMSCSVTASTVIIGAV